MSPFSAMALTVAWRPARPASAAARRPAASLLLLQASVDEDVALMRRTPYALSSATISQSIGADAVTGILL